MATRRRFLAATGLFVAGAALARAQELCAVSTKNTQAAGTADQALMRLQEGNQRFLTGRTLHCDLVLGHSDCGAIKGAVDDVKLGNLTEMLSNIRPSVLKLAGAEGDHTSKNKKFVQSVAEQNAKDAAASLTARSDVLAALVKDHKLKIVAAMHDVSTGAVKWFA
jgi:hypothetical protein